MFLWKTELGNRDLEYYKQSLEVANVDTYTFCCGDFLEKFEGVS